MEEKQEQIKEEEIAEEQKNMEVEHCFHKFVRFKNYRRCIKCGMEIDK